MTNVTRSGIVSNPKVKYFKHMKKIITTFIVSILFFASVTNTFAEDQVCVQSYGQPVVCGNATPPFHSLVKTGIADFNITAFGSLFIIAAGVLYYYSIRKTSA